MWRVVWADPALDDLLQVWEYVSDFSPAAAARLISRLRAAGDDLAVYPNRGRSIDGGRRELVVVTPYVITYVVVQREVRILSIRHAARRPDGEPG